MLETRHILFLILYLLIILLFGRHDQPLQVPGTLGQESDCEMILVGEVILESLSCGMAKSSFFGHETSLMNLAFSMENYYDRMINCAIQVAWEYCSTFRMLAISQSMAFHWMVENSSTDIIWQFYHSLYVNSVQFLYTGCCQGKVQD